MLTVNLEDFGEPIDTVDALLGVAKDPGKHLVVTSHSYEFLVRFVIPDIFKRMGKDGLGGYSYSGVQAHGQCDIRLFNGSTIHFFAWDRIEERMRGREIDATLRLP